MWGISQKEKNGALKKALRDEKWDEVRKAVERGADANLDISGYGRPLFKVMSMWDDGQSLELVTLLLARGADVNKTDNDGCTPLQYLIGNRHSSIGVLKKLLDQGADMTALYRGSAPLRMAMARGAWPAAEALLDRKPDLERQALKGETMLMTAVGKGAPLALVKRLMEQPIDINAASPGTAAALHLAVAGNRLDLVDYLLGLPGINVNIPDSGKRTPLLAAAAADRRDIAAALLKAGADANLADAEGNTALLAAAGLEVSALAKTLLAAGAAADQADKAGLTPLLAAVLRKNRSTVNFLLAAGAAPDRADNRGLTPLLSAVQQDSPEVAVALLAGGASPGLAGPGGLLPLTAAAQQGSVRLVKVLLGAADAAQPPLDLAAALFAASEKGYGGVIELLVAAGADVNAADADGRTPLMKACLTDQIEVMSILIKAGARSEAEDRRGMQAYDHAVAGGKNQSKDYLARFRSSEIPRGPAPGVPGSGEEDRYARLNSYSLEVRETESLSVIFNFWMQQVLFRDTALGGPVAVQNFGDVQRQEAIEEAFEKLKALGGDPPALRTSSLQKKPAGLRGGGA